MAEFQIISQDFPEPDADGNTVSKTWYTFTVDGVPSLRWFRACTTEGMPKTHHVERCINRLKAGRSRESFGPAPEVAINGQALRADTPSAADAAAQALREAGVADGQVRVMIDALRKSSQQGRGRVWSEDGPAPQGRTSSGKARPARPVWRYSLDGQTCPQTFPTEAAARGACATRAFMTRSKLGRISEAQKALEAQFPGQECKVWACPKEHGIRAKAGGVEYSVGFEPDGSFRFKRKEK